MDSTRKYFLLALVLLEVALCAENRECESGKVNCDITEVNGKVVRVKCGGDIHEATGTDQDSFSGDIINNGRTSQVHPINYLNNTPLSILDQENSPDNRSYDEVNLDSDQINVTSNHFQEHAEPNIYSDNNIPGSNQRNIFIDQINKGSNKTNGEVNNTYIKKTSELINNKWSGVKPIQIHLINNYSFLDLSPFTNARTMILDTPAYSLIKICGVENVTHLSSTSSKLENVSFIRHLTSLRHLNFSNNAIKAIPTAELNHLITTVDLSYNNVIFDTDINLPESLQILNVSYNNITNVDGVILKGNVIILDIRGNRLEQVPVFDMNNLEELYLSRNNISILQEGVFQNLTSLTILDLSNNCLTSLQGRAFEGLYRLQLLDMSENNVIYLAPSTFQYLNNLVTLLLSGNTNLGNLQDIEEASLLFGTGQRLQIIEASRTNLTRIPSTLTRSVRKLFIAANAIESVQCGELDSFPLLQFMDLSSNFIADIEEDALGRLDFLSQLLLSRNKLTTVPKSLPDQLEILDMRCNSIEKLNNVDFLGLQKLRVLLLSRNKISVIEDGAFGQLSSLEVLELSHNPIKLLSRTSFIGPRKLKEVYLVSLTDLVPFQEPLSFPAPESAHLEVLNIESSPVLATQLMDDVAALTMFHELFELNLNHCRLSTLRSDLPRYLPRLHKLELTGNVLNCTNIIWLVKWLQALNISMQDPGKSRKEIYNLKDIYCGDVSPTQSYDGATLMCNSPEYLSGKQIIYLTEEDFPELKLTSSALPTERQVIITQPYRSQTFDETLHNISSSELRMSESTTKAYGSTNSEVHSINKKIPTFESTLSQPEDVKPTVYKIKALQHQSLNNYSISDKSKMKSSKLSKLLKPLPRTAKKYKYGSENKYKPLSVDSTIVLQNGTKSIVSDFDNQRNESVSIGTYLAQELPSTSHPGMVVFLLVVSVLLIASLAMVYSQCSQSQRGRNYHHHQDIEVSSFGGSDLW